MESTAATTAPAAAAAATAVDASTPVDPTIRSTNRRAAAIPEPNSQQLAAAAVAAANGNNADPNATNATITDQSTEPQPIQYVLLQIETPTGRIVKVETTPADSVIDIRQFLLDCPETCEYTSYHLEHIATGTILNDYIQLNEYTMLCDGLLHELRLIPDFYDERAIRIHIRRFRELLINPPANIIQTLIPAIDEQLIQQQQSQSNNNTVNSNNSNSSNKGKKGNKSNKNNNSNNNNITAANTNTTAANDNISIDSNPYSLTNLLPSNSNSIRNRRHNIVNCLNTITYSPYNPPPGNRKLRGDLFYLELQTLEGKKFHITCSVDGFYLNNTTDNLFNPIAADPNYKSNTLVELLKKCSPLFASKFQSLLNRKIYSHPFEQIEIQPSIIPNQWVNPSLTQLHTADWNRSEDSLLSTYGIDSNGVQRDWNEEYQSCRELPKSTLNERMIRDRTLYRIYSEFTEAARLGAVAVINGHIPPVNPLDSIRQHVFIYNNIFYSFAIDGRDLYQSAIGGGDRVSESQSSHDLHGVELISGLDISDLYTLATVVVDYRGHRLICQSIIPGIFHGERASKHVYGSMDLGELVVAKPEFHLLVKQAAEQLHCADHQIIDSAGTIVTLASSVESKGIIGSDGRNYLLDLIRLQPRDANYSNHSTHPTHLLRQELIQLYCRKLAVEQVFPKSTDKPDSSAEDKSTDFHDNLDDNYLKALAEIQFNPDLLTNAKLADSSEILDQQKSRLVAASEFLVNEVIPKFITGLRNLEYSPVDSKSYTQLLHSKGINIRYLGRIATAAAAAVIDNKSNNNNSAAGLSHIVSLSIQEMIVRSAKHILANILRSIHPDRSAKIENWFFAPQIARFLSALLGPNCAGLGLRKDQLQAAIELANQKKNNNINTENNNETTAVESTASAVTVTKSKKGKKSTAVTTQSGPDIRLSDGSRAPTDPLSAANLWQSIRTEVEEHFNYSLPESIEFNQSNKLSMLRSICIKCGIQLLARDYELEPTSKNYSPITIDDILDLLPVLKCAFPVSADAANLYNSGQAYLSQSRFPIAYEYFHESLSLNTQIYGPMNSLTGDSYNSLALVCYHAADYTSAMDYQQRALIIYERVLGIDNYRTAEANMSMGLYFHSVGQSAAALKHVKRAVFLFNLISGNNHPDTAAAHMNLAMILQDISTNQSGILTNTAEAIKHLLLALDINIATLGPEHVQTGLTHHTLAVAYALHRQFRNAIESEKRSKSIFTAVLGSKHQRILQSQSWLDHFTSLAVKFEQPAEFQKQLIQPITIQSLIPTGLQSKIHSPLTWVSLQNSLTLKSKLTMNDILEIFESAAKNQQLTAKENQSTAAINENQTASAATVATTVGAK